MKNIEHWRIRMGSDIQDIRIPDEELRRRRLRVMAVLIASPLFDSLHRINSEQGGTVDAVIMSEEDVRGDMIIRCTEAVADALADEIRSVLEVDDCFHVAYGPESC